MGIMSELFHIVCSPLHITIVLILYVLFISIRYIRNVIQGGNVCISTLLLSKQDNNIGVVAAAASAAIPALIDIAIPIARRKCKCIQFLGSFTNKRIAQTF